MPAVSDLMVDRVGALLDVRVSNATTPSEDQVKDWLYEGALVLTKLLPVALLGTMMDSVTSTVGEEWDISGSNVVRVVAIEKNGAPCKHYPYPDFLHMQENMPSLHSDALVAASVTGNAGGKSVIKFFPTTSNSATLTFVTEPAQVDDWLESASPHLIPPDTWTDLIVDFAVMKGKIQDEEEQAATMLYQMWMQGVQAFAAGEVLGTDAE